MKLFLHWVIFMCCIGVGQSQVTLSGYVKNASSGETLIGANLYVVNNEDIGAYTNNYGFYSLQVPKDSFVLGVSYLGFQDAFISVSSSGSKRLNIDLVEGVLIQEVVVTSMEEDENVRGSQMGTVKLATEQIKSLPVLFGEVDILKSLQLLPGVSSVGEGNAGIYVRGGGPDQNLILLDEAVVYNSGHMLGFFSIFNGDAIKNTTLIKGGMPANYGGRLSSVVDVRMKDGNNKKWSAEGGVGLISSRLTVEGPIVKDKSSFILSARRTYLIDIVQPFIKNSNFSGTNYYFYDLNSKINYIFGDKDRIYLSAYVGRDVLKYESGARNFSLKMPYGNATFTTRWNHLFNDKFFMNVSAIVNNYVFDFIGKQDILNFEMNSEVKDLSIKMDFDYFYSNRHSFKFGGQSIYHTLSPQVLRASNGESSFESDFVTKYALENALYVQDEWSLSSNVQMNLGLRFSSFSQLGPYVSSSNDNRNYAAFERVVNYKALEPRISLRWSLQKNISLKASWNISTQYLHLVSNSTSTLPTDIWVPSTEKVPPQRVQQYALGYFQNFAHNQYELSVETYYKILGGQIDYAENYVNNLSNELENEFVFGDGLAYGVEFFVKKRLGDWNGWLGYTWSRSERQFDDIENGQTFLAVYDRPNDFSAVVNYKLDNKWSFSGVAIYGTGQNYTPLRSVYFIENNLNIRYGPRNSVRIRPYHRIDISSTYIPGGSKKKGFKSSWTFSVYNVYNRKNPLFIYYTFDQGPSNTTQAKAIETSLFPIIPSITWNFKWQ